MRGEHLTTGVAKQSAGQREHIGLVSQCHPLGTSLLGHLDDTCSELLTCRSADLSLRDGNVFALHVLATDIQPFAILPQDKHVDTAARRDDWPAAHRAQVAVQAELLAQGENGAAIPSNLARR